PLDDKALQFLYPMADKDLLARIRNARLPQSHFECLLQALQSSFIYDRLIISWVNELRSEEHTSELQSQSNIVCRLLLEKKNKIATNISLPEDTKFYPALDAHSEL